ncbi:hypothetical protein J0X00_02565 [Vibrio sp. ABG19]|nr:carbamoyltransferase C-terminal domain-containing protein [Vibrio sp. ABG19]WGY45751.1 hypothetical protein J0X00_02565 [Vibrio sp. ABG19]
MTVTYDCTDYFAQACPAVTHIDKTARPQVITQQSDPFMYRVLIGWESISGEPALINTSFNMHEEPIILNIDNALKNLERGVVDVLVINEQLLVWKSDSSKNEEIIMTKSTFAFIKCQGQVIAQDLYSQDAGPTLQEVLKQKAIVLPITCMASDSNEAMDIYHDQIETNMDVISLFGETESLNVN